MRKSELRQMIQEELQVLNEASEISFDDLAPLEKRLVQNLQKILRVKKPENFFYGIHGYIVMFSHSSVSGMYRFDIDEIKKLATISNIRWVESDKKYVTVAFSGKKVGSGIAPPSY